MADEKKTRTITLFDGPVKIVEEDWPAIAYGEWFPGEHLMQAFDRDWLRVREHEDGRTIVYGFSGDGPNGGRPGREERRGGVLLTEASRQDLVEAIRRVASELELNESVARATIADLPAIEI